MKNKLNFSYYFSSLFVNKYFHFFIFCLLFCLINFMLFRSIGIKITADSPRYLNYAENISKIGFYYESHNFWYLAYVLLLWGLSYFSSSTVLIIIVQVILSGLTTFLVFKISFNLFKDYYAALIAVFAFIVYPDLLRWNFYVLCESFYIFCLVSCFYCLISHKKALNLLAYLLICFTFFCKPTGVALLFAFLISKFYFIFTNKNKFYFFLIFIFISFPAYFLLNQMLATFTLIETYQTGELVYDLHNFPDSFASKNLLLIDNKQLYVPPPSSKPLLRVLDFIFHNPFFAFKLVFGKLILFLCSLKPYYSLQHNLYIAICLFPLYFFGFLTFFKTAIPKPIKLFFTLYFVFHALIVMFTIEDWDGRFIIPILPLIFIFGAKGIRTFAFRRMPFYC